MSGPWSSQSSWPRYRRRPGRCGWTRAYILQLVDATRSSTDLVLGASPRGTQALTRASRAYALLEGRDFTIPDDVKAVAVAVLAHRVLPAGDPLAGARPTAETIAELVDAEPPPA